jgi:hypothetical protein
MVISLIATLVKRLGAICLAFVIFWHVAQHAGPRRGKAIVHVSRSDVVVAVDHRDYRVESTAQSPLVCDLEPGEHVAQIRHGEALLDEQTFTIKPGEEAIIYLADHFPTYLDSAKVRPAPKDRNIRSTDLAADTRRPRRDHAHN